MMIQVLHPMAKKVADGCPRCVAAQGACFHDRDVVWGPVKTPPGTYELITLLPPEQIALLARWANDWERAGRW